jgi:hypothetical protein
MSKWYNFWLLLLMIMRTKPVYLKQTTVLTNAYTGNIIISPV